MRFAVANTQIHRSLSPNLGLILLQVSLLLLITKRPSTIVQRREFWATTLPTFHYTTLGRCHTTGNNNLSSLHSIPIPTPHSRISSHFRALRTSVTLRKNRSLTWFP